MRKKSTYEELKRENEILQKKLCKIDDNVKRSHDIVENIETGLHIYYLENIDDDATLRMVYANPITEKLTGVAVKEVLNKTIDENFPGLREKGIPQMYANVIRTNKSVKIEDVYYGDDRVIKAYYKVKAFPLPNNHVGVAFEDITEQKNAELQLFETSKLNQEIIANAQHGIVVSGKDLRYKVWNPFMEKLTGIPASSMIGSYPLDSFPFLHDNELSDKLFGVINHGISFQVEFPFKVNDSNIEGWAIDFSSPLINEENIIIGVLSIVVDITKLKKAEQNLKKYADELSQMNKDKDRFLTILAHDLRSPFNSLLAFSGMLLRNIRKYDIDKIEDQLKTIFQTTDRTYHLLEDLLLWSKSQSGKLTVKPQKIVFGEICTKIINDLRQQSATKEISINYFESEKIFLTTDLNMFKTVIRNLISNAIKFTNPKGQINISIEKDLLNAIIIVSDNGVGIKIDDLPKLWDFTHPISTSGTANEKGTGFGLIICKEFVEKLGGDIWAESEYGKGSDFKFTLPLYND